MCSRARLKHSPECLLRPADFDCHVTTGIMADAEVSPASVPSADGDGGAAQHDVRQCAAADHTGSPSPPAQPLDDTTWAVEPLQAVRGLLHHLRYIQTFTLEAVRRRRSSSVTDEPSTGAAPHPARVPSSAPRPGRKRARSQSADSTAHSLNDPLWVRHPSLPTRSALALICRCLVFLRAHRRRLVGSCPSCPCRTLRCGCLP